MPSSREDRRAIGGGAAFLLALGAVLALKWGSLTEPPFWDAAMGLFPAAITLSATGFDLLGLLAMPGYQEGGPNAYGTSPVTLLTAVVFEIAGSGSRAFVVLHLVHFGIAALAVATLYGLVRPSLRGPAALLLCLGVLLHPTFSAQVGSMYMEVVLFLCAVSAVRAWMNGRFRSAVLWGTLGWATKQTGGIVPAALAVATALERRPLADKARRIGWLLGLPALWTAGVTALNRIALGGEAYRIVPSLDVVFGDMGQYLRRFLLNVPDLLAFVIVFALAAAVMSRRIFRALREEPTAPGHRAPEQRELLLLGLSGLVIVFFALLFLVALPVLAGFTIILPRYYVVILPFLLVWVGLSVQRLAGSRFARAPSLTYGALAIAFALNTNGALYPPDIDTEGPGNDPPLTERSNAYKRLLALQMEAMATLQDLPRGVPVYYGHFEHYLLRYPNLGYARGPLGEGHNLSVESLSPIASAEPFPPCVFALYNYPWLGGEKIRGLIRLPEARPELTTEVVRELRDGPYAIRLVRIRRRDADCPA